MTALSVAAQGDEGSRELFRETSGRFEIALQVEPAEVVAGLVHFVVTVLDAGASSPVDGATVSVVAAGPGGSAVQPRAVSAPG